MVGGALGDPDRLAELDPGDGPAGQDPDLGGQAEALQQGGADLVATRSRSASSVSAQIDQPAASSQATTSLGMVWVRSTTSR